MTNKIFAMRSPTPLALTAIKLKIIFYQHLERSHTSTTEVALRMDRKMNRNTDQLLKYYLIFFFSIAATLRGVQYAR